MNASPQVKSNVTMNRVIISCLLFIVAIVALSCQESLPVYMPPQNIMTMKISLVEELDSRVAPPGHQAIHIVMTGQNVFDEVFYDSVDIKGSVRVWWERKANFFGTLYLTSANFVDKELIHDGKMLLSPGQQFTVETFWDMKSDDSVYLPGRMDFSFFSKRPYCDVNIKCANPELFMAEATLNVYDKIGYISAAPKEFTFIAKVCNLCGVGPACPPPPGGCGSAQP